VKKGEEGDGRPPVDSLGIVERRLRVRADRLSRARTASEQDVPGGFTPVMAFVRAFAWPSQPYVPGKEVCF
jgi:hypothetical protein